MGTFFILETDLLFPRSPPYKVVGMGRGLKTLNNQFKVCLSKVEMCII